MSDFSLQEKTSQRGIKSTIKLFFNTTTSYSPFFNTTTSCMYLNSLNNANDDGSEDEFLSGQCTVFLEKGIKSNIKIRVRKTR